MKAEVLYAAIEEIRELIQCHTDSGGNLQFDGLRVQIALDFTKRELAASISQEPEEET